MKRDFNKWLEMFRETIATWKYYTDFEKIYKNVNLVKDELNILNGLVGVKDIRQEFKRIISKYPETLKVIPLLLAKREKEIKINDAEQNYNFNFKSVNYSFDEYADFMEKTGLFDLLQNHVVNSLVDYVTGVEAGMDTNGRKNRTGDAMEDLVESYLIKEGLVKDKDYFKEMSRSTIEKKWNMDLSGISNTGKTEKRFDFVVKKGDTVYAIETNFYASQGSKLNETARSYKNLALESKGIKNFAFVWFTDGVGWKKAKHNLEETFDVMENIYCIKELEEGIMKNLFV